MSRRDTHPAIELLAQFAPGDVLERARALAQQIERDEYLRGYLAQRSVAIVAVAVAAMLAGFVAIGGVAMLMLPWAARQALWLRAALVLCAGVFWCVGVLVPTYLFLARLERAALQAREREEQA